MAARLLVSVEEVSGRAAMRRFVELPWFIHRGEPRWAPPLVGHERARLDPRRNPFFESGDGVYLLARRLGKAAGRCTAHVAEDEDPAGWFGFYDAIDDPDVVAVLVEAAMEWLRERGCTSMSGPASFTVDEPGQPGLLVEGFDSRGTTGRPWSPPWYGAHLEGVGLRRVQGSERPMWRIPAAAGAGCDLDVDPQPVASGIVGRYADPRLALHGPAGAIVAVPDIHSGQGRFRKQFEGCTTVRCDGDAAVLVPGLAAAAAEAGYQWVVAPWSPDPAARPETIHALFTLRL